MLSYSCIHGKAAEAQSGAGSWQKLHNLNTGLGPVSADLVLSPVLCPTRQWETHLLLTL